MWLRKIGVFLFLISTVAFAATENYLPIVPGSWWRYKQAQITDTCIDNTGNFKCSYLQYPEYDFAEYGISIYRDSVLANNLIEAQVYSFSYNQDGNTSVFNYSKYWQIKNDTVFISERHLGDSVVHNQFCDFASGTPGQIGIGTRNDTIAILQQQTIAVPAGIFTCMVTEFRNAKGLLISPFYPANPGTTRIVTFKALNVGIVRVVIYENGKKYYLYDLSEYHLEQKTSLNYQKSFINNRLVQRNRQEFPIAYNLRGQRVVSKDHTHYPSGLYVAYNAERCRIILNLK